MWKALVTILIASGYAQVTPTSEAERNYLLYAAKFNKSVTSSEELAKRAAILNKNLVEIEALNKQVPSATFA